MRGEPAQQLDRRRPGARAGIGERSSARIARASRAVGPFRAGVEAWPPRPSTRSSTLVVPFSVTPIDADRPADPGERVVRDRAALVEHEPRPDAAASSSATAPRRVGPNTSSSQPKESQTSWAGREASLEQPLDGLADRRPGSPCRRGCRGPRPRRRRSRRENGGCCQGADSSTGTTSRCAISTTGRSALAPAPVEQQAVGADAGQLEALVEQRELPRAARRGERRTRAVSTALGVAVGDGRDPDQRLQLRHGARSAQCGDACPRDPATRARTVRRGRDRWLGGRSAVRAPARQTSDRRGRRSLTGGRRPVDWGRVSAQEPRWTTSSRACAGARRRARRRPSAPVADRDRADRVEVVRDAELRAHGGVRAPAGCRRSRRRAPRRRRSAGSAGSPSRRPCARTAPASGPRPRSVQPLSASAYRSR